MALGILRQAGPSGVEVGVLADAGKDIECFAPGRGGVPDPIGRDEREAIMFRQFDQLAIEAFFTPNEMALQFHVDAIAAKGIEEQLRALCRIPGSTGW
jgi:hypothetical protein